MASISGNHGGHLSEKHVATYTTAAEAKPFTLDCGHSPAYIHYDDGDVPYLLIADENGNAWRVYGYAQVSCDICGRRGEWLPSRSGMLKVIEAYRKGREAARRARAELGG